jgi:outer membrane autotransporter protein
MWNDRHCKAARSPKQPNGNAESACRLVAAALAAFFALLAPGSPPPARGQTFEEASNRALVEISENQWGTGPLAGLNSNFPAGVVSAAPATTTQQAGGASAIERRLQTVRESEERRRRSDAAPAIYASYLSDAIQTDDRRLQLPRPGGAGSEIAVGLAHGLSVFLSAGASLLQHHDNKFEDGYTAHQPTATIGADYLFTPRLLGGVTFTYTRVDGSYNSAGDFDTDVFSPAVYGLFLPFEGAFVSGILSYARNENSNHRTVTIPNADGNLVVTGQAFGEYVEHQVSADFQTGYDHRLGNFTVGPRFGLAIGHSHIDAFREEGDSGGELRYSDFDQTSVQSKLGVVATVAIRIPNGVLLPQANVAWVHEYANGERDVKARFIHASPSPHFTFKRERPARDWASIALGLSASLVNGWQPFVQFVTMQGNENYVSYGGTAGLRFSF